MHPPPDGPSGDFESSSLRASIGIPASPHILSGQMTISIFEGLWGAYRFASPG